MVELDTKPYWIRTASLPVFPRLDRNLTVDVAIVGGGLVGITTAYLLKLAGVSVALFERGRLAMIDTGHTTAHLTMVTDPLLTELVKDFGEATATAVWDGGRLAIDRIEAHIAAEGIDCEFARVPGFLHKALTGKGLSDDELRQQADQASRLGFKASYLDEVRPFNFPGARFEQQALFHPRKYLSGLVQRVHANDGHVFEHSTVEDVKAEPLTLMVDGYTVSPGYVVVATHTPLQGKTNIASATLLQSKLALYSSYALGGRVPRGHIPHGLYWDTTDPYHYFRVEPQQGFDYIIFGGADHKTGQVSDTEKCYETLERTLRRFVPVVELTDRWSGQVIETNDGLPYIGETSPRQFVATGFAGNGMTFGTLAAMMARDAVLGRTNPWRELFDPGRTSIRAGAWDYIRENKDYVYYMIADRVNTSHQTTLRGLKPGQGALVKLDGKAVAAYRDPQGVVTLRSAICTHMGCEVNWNQAEATWDCPCHGSRFKTDGSVISGPAESPLSPIEP